MTVARLPARLWAYPLVAAIIVALPALDFTTIDILLVFAAYAALGISWNWAAGLGGLLNLAHVAYYALGAYACGIAVASLGVHPVIGMLVGMAVAAGLAWAICAASLKLRVADLYFGLLTLTLMEGLAAILRGIENEYALGGISLPFRNNPATLQFLDKTAYYYLLAGLALVMVALQQAVQRSRFGLMIVSSRDNALTAASVGVAVQRVLTAVAVVSALPAALVGSLLTLSSLHVTADAVFSIELLLSVITVVVIGGLGTLWGPFIGAAIITAIQELIRRGMGGVGVAGVTDIVYGLMLVAIIIFVPEGIAGLLARIRARRRS